MIATRPVWWIGVDPGLHGAFAMLNENGQFVVTPAHYPRPVGGQELSITRNPIIAGAKGARDMHDVVAIDREFQRLRELAESQGAEPRVALEHVGAMPGQGTASMFSFGMGVGLWLALCTATKTPLHRIRPQDWQRIVLRGRSRKDVKQTAVAVALELWPTAPIRGKKDHGVADAMLIAEAARRLMNARTPAAARA